MSTKKRFLKLVKAFNNDGFIPKDFRDNTALMNTGFVQTITEGGKTYTYLEVEGKIGIAAACQPPKSDSKRPTPKVREAFYIEGSSHQMGLMMGLMAEPQISTMTTAFITNAILDLIDLDKIPQTSRLVRYIEKLLIDDLGKNCRKSMACAIPVEYQKEIEGILEGCKKVNPRTKVCLDELWALNFGIDYLLAHVFTGHILKKKHVHPKILKVKMMCNAFSIHGKGITENEEHFFGRDFMFTTGGVFQDLACLIIYNPDPVETESGEIRKGQPLVSQAAPGFIGSIAAMNLDGVAMGVDVHMSSLCTPESPGLNSLPLVRDTIQYCISTDEAVNHVINAPRGVTWFYPIASATKESNGSWKNNAVILEAGANVKTFPYKKGVDGHYKSTLPPQSFIDEMEEKYDQKPVNGLMVRGLGYQWPEEYWEWNKDLWRRYNHDLLRRIGRFLLDLISGIILVIKHPTLIRILKVIIKELGDLIHKVPFRQNYNGEKNYINIMNKLDENCPGPFYFSPQRENIDNLVILTNHAITPEFRLTAMHKWISLVAASHINGFQWRYDELNFQLLEAMKKAKDDNQLVSAENAKDIIDFLRPNSDNPNPSCREFYNPDFKINQDEVHTIPIEGSISLCELKQKIMHSYFGYYDKGWVTINLAEYF